MKRYKVHELKKINVFGYFILFFALLIAAGILVNMWSKYDNLTAIIFILFAIADGFICYKLSMVAASKPMTVVIDNGQVIFDRGLQGMAKVPITDIMGFEIVERRTAPKHLFILTCGEGQVRMFGGRNNDDLIALERYFASQPNVVTDEQEGNQPTSE